MNTFAAPCYTLLDVRVKASHMQLSQTPLKIETACVSLQPSPAGVTACRLFHFKKDIDG